MDNVPRIPMFIVPLKISPVAPDISPIKKKIRKRYGEQTFINEDIFRNFLALRTECCKFPSDENSLVIIKRYYAHLMLLKNRIDLTTPKLVEWPWQDAFYQKQFVRTEITYEEAAILYGLGAAYAHLGRKQSRMEGESMKTACTYFQCAAWIFQSLRERYGSFTGAEDMTGDLFHIYSLICLSQAQECIAEKAIADKRSPSITAKLVKNLAESYERCAAMVSVLDESVPPKFRKDWSRVILIKKSYYSSLVNYFLALDNANEMKFGITVAHYKLAQTDIEEAWRVAKTFTDSIEPQLGQSMIATIQFAREIIVKGCADAIKDNSQIYHELVPQPQDLAKIEGACLAKPTPFDYTDREVIGEDIFKDLLPLKTLKASSVYSEKKADFLRKVLADVEEKDTNLSSFLSSLNLDPKELLKPDSGLPQALLDQCAKFNAMECSPESQLTAQMSALVDISVDVEADLEELSDAIQRTQERLNAISPTAPASKVGPIKEQLNKVFDRYGKFTAAKAQAKESNTRLHEALTEHLKTLHILTRTPEEIEATLPNANHLITDSELLEGLDEAARILSKVEEMRAQRTRMLEDLRAGLQADDITQELLTTSTTEERNALFQRHLDVHQKAVDLLNLNLTAQENISRALIDAHAKVGVKKHDILKCRRQRAEEIDDLVRSGEAYDDLILKCGEGQAFYHDISERLTALHTDLDRINIAIDDLEMKNTFPPSISAHQPASAFSVPLPALIPPADTVSKGPPRLRDVMRARAAAAENDAKGQPGIPLTNPIQVPPAIAPGAQAYWQPSPPTQVWQPNVTTSNTSTPAAVEPAQPSPTPNATAQQQGQFMQTSQMVGYPGSYYQSPYFACIQYPSRSPVPQQNQAFGQRPQQYPSVTGYPHQQYRPTVPPVQQNPSPLPLSGSQSSLAGMINQQYRPPAPVIQQSSSHIPHLQNQGSLSGVMNQSQQQCQPTIPPVQQSSSPLPQSESQTSLPGISNLPQQQYGSNTPPVQQQFGVPVQPAYPQKIRHSISVRPILPMPDQNQQQYRPVVPVVQPTMSQSIRTTTPMPQPIQSPFKSSNPSPQPTQSTSGAPLKFSEMMSRTQYGIPSPSLFQPTPQATVQPPPAAVTQLKPATPDTTTTETTGTNTQKMKFSEMMSKGYGSITPTPTPQFFGQVTPVISQPNGNKQNPQQPPQVYAQYAGFGTPNYGQLYHAGQQYPYAFQQPGIPSAYNPSVIATSQSSQQQNGTSAVSKQGPKVAEKAVVSTPNPQEVKKEAPIPTAEVKISSPFEEILPEDTTLQPTEPPQPTAVEFVPESVASLDAINTPEDQEKEPITPTVLTQLEDKSQENMEKIQEVQENKLETESNGVFRDLPSHLVDLSLTDESTNGSPSNRRHYLARDFTDPEYKKSRDGLASDKNPFGDLDPLNQVTSGTDN
ncbi:unnamed protein product [Hymenolepis diminuta]|uniref:BRO1 domain-containing protein n=2 Tax=Hymenolepis diminuta TaxID=6216 RepID=A0A564ZCJ5_HYMDI|nr:unnamed protein product [Hymenolepis diminuta]